MHEVKIYVYLNPRPCRCWPIIRTMSLSHFDINFGQETPLAKFLHKLSLVSEFVMLYGGDNENALLNWQFFMVVAGERRLRSPSGEAALACSAMSGRSGGLNRGFLCGGRVQPPSSLSDEEARLARCIFMFVFEK